MAGVRENLRKMTISSEDGKDVKDTSMLKGEAKMTSAFKEKNSTTQYTCEKPPTKDIGGEAALN